MGCQLWLRRLAQKILERPWPGLPGRGLRGRGLPGRGLPGRGLPGRGLPGLGLQELGQLVSGLQKFDFMYLIIYPILYDHLCN